MKHSHDDLELPDNEESMTPNEIIKAMDEFAALQAKATPGPFQHRRERRRGIHITSKHGCVATAYNETDSEFAGEAGTNNANMFVTSRSIPAAEAAALIREMREMLRKMEWTQGVDETAQKFCPWCGNTPSWNHAPDCKLAQMLKD